MKYWKLVQGKIDAMSLRERVMLFAIATLLLFFILNMTLLNPLSNRQKIIAAKLTQQFQETQALQASMQAIVQAERDDAHSPLRTRIKALKAQIQESNSFLQSLSDRLVTPEKMGELLEQVLHSNEKLQLVELKTLPLSLLLEPADATKVASNTSPQVYKHGVQITVRGNYLELLRYLTSLENLPARMFWGEMSLTVDKYPDAVLVLTVYTLSLDKTWLTV